MYSRHVGWRRHGGAGKRDERTGGESFDAVRCEDENRRNPSARHSEQTQCDKAQNHGPATARDHEHAQSSAAAAAASDQDKDEPRHNTRAQSPAAASRRRWRRNVIGSCLLRCRSPLLARSGHGETSRACPLSEAKRTSAVVCF